MIYLDNSSTTLPAREVVQAVDNALTYNFGNSSSRHTLGLMAEKAVRDASESIAELLKVSPDEIVFTSGGTESDNLAIRGSVNRPKHVITTAIEHPAVLASFKRLEDEGFSVTYLKPGTNGNISLEEFESALREDTVLVSMMHVNNETGTILPVDRLKPIMSRKAPNALLHCDAVQSFGKYEVLPKKWGIDLLSFSGHKIHGPKGVGGLYVRKGVKLRPLIVGGEDWIRPGTQNVPGIVGLGVAARISDFSAVEHIKKLKMILYREISQIPDIELNGTLDGSEYILNVSFIGVRSEVLLNALSSEGIYVSSGSACSARRPSPSHVLVAMGKKHADSAIRFSFSKYNTVEDVQITASKLKSIVAELRAQGRR